MSEYYEDEISGKIYDMRLIRRMAVFLRPYWKKVLLIFLLMPGMVWLNLLPPLLVGKAIDGPLSTGDTKAMSGIITLFLVAILGHGIISLWHTYLTTWVGQQAMNDLRVRVFSHLQSMSLGYYDRNPVGKLMTRTTSDVESVNQFFSQGVVTILTDIFMILAICGTMLWKRWDLALATFSVLPLLIGVSFLFRRLARNVFRRSRFALSKLNAFTQEHISGMMVLQLFTREDKAIRDFGKANDEYFDSLVDTVKVFAVFLPLIELISSFALAVIICFGARKIGLGEIDFGLLVTFIYLTEKFYEPIRDLSDKYNTLQQAMASGERIFQVLDTANDIPDAPDAIALKKFRGEIEFRNVWFSYAMPEAGKSLMENDWVIKDLSFTIKPGEKIAFVGHTGAGKTTIASLLLRFYDIQRGEILIDGQDIRKYKQASLRESFAIVLQDVFLFSGSILENIRLGNLDITEDRVWEVCRYVNADRFIGRMEGGLNAKVEERGINLSTGQRQLIAFARALVHDPQLLILDEATSSVDTETEIWIQDALQKIIRDKNTIVIAHRLSTIEKSDRIFVLHHGRLREKGRHDELLKQGGLYYKLYQLQYKDQAV